MLTFNEFFDHHYLPYVKPRKRSWRRDEELYRLRIKEKFGNRRLNQISRQQIQLFHTEVLASGLAPGTADHHLRFLKHAFNLAIDWGLLTEKNPAARIPLFAVDNKVENYLDDDQLEICLPSCAPMRIGPSARSPSSCSSTGCTPERGPGRHAGARSTGTTGCGASRPATASRKRVRSVPLNDAALEVLASSTRKAASTTCSSTRKPANRIRRS